MRTHLRPETKDNRKRQAARRIDAESVRALLKHPRYSKRINYDALRNLFEHPAAPGSPLGEQKEDIDAGLWTMDADKFEADADAEGVVVEEGGGGVGVGGRGRVEGGEDGEDGYGEADVGDYGEWDGYEQEV